MFLDKLYVGSFGLRTKFFAAKSGSIFKAKVLLEVRPYRHHCIIYDCIVLYSRFRDALCDDLVIKLAGGIVK